MTLPDKPLRKKNFETESKDSHGMNVKQLGIRFKDQFTEILSSVTDLARLCMATSVFRKISLLASH